MRWSIVILLILGVLAAISASILVGALRVDRTGQGKSAKDAQVVLATKSLPAMAVVTSECIKKDTVSKDKLPAGYITSHLQAIGRVLAVPVVEGQVLTQSCFLSEGTPAQLAASLPYGMRAVSVVISEQSFNAGLLYPGCVVDVLASFGLQTGRESRGSALSTTLLRGIQVLAVEDFSVVSKQSGDEKASERGRNSRVRVTLMVEPRQAEALQLAISRGTISLAMRNPLDKNPVALGTTVLSQDKLAKFGSTMDSTVQKTGDEALFTQGESGEPTDNILEALSGQELKDSSPEWEVTVIRGKEVKEEVVSMPEEGGETADEEESGGSR